MRDPHQLGAEAIGTFGLVFGGTGAIIINSETGALWHVGIAITFGLIVMVMIYATGHISGANLNPAVTLAFAITRHLPWPRAAGYWLAQLAGASIASLLLRSLFGTTAHLGATLPRGSASQSLILEIVLTFFLMVVIMAVATDTRAVGQAAAIATGGTVGLEAMFAGPISGASMNPARSLAPALVSGTCGRLSGSICSVQPRERYLAPLPTSLFAAKAHCRCIRRRLRPAGAQRWKRMRRPRHNRPFQDGSS